MKKTILPLLMIEYIKAFPFVQPRYKYEGENSINPVYCDLEHCDPLCVNENRIWVLRRDLTLALGIKNANTSKGNTSLLHKTDAVMHPYINRNDRYGHPSLAIPEGEYDGSVYYAGWIHQHTNRIDVFIFSGRYHNTKLLQAQKIFLESYLALKLTEAFGQQKIIFIDWGYHEDELEYFLNGIAYPFKQPARRYHSQVATTIHCALMLFFFISQNLPEYQEAYQSSKKIIISQVKNHIEHAYQWVLLGVLRCLILLFLKERATPKLITLGDQQTPPLAGHLPRMSLFKPKTQFNPPNEDTRSARQLGHSSLGGIE